jgi:excisionase family DNA binding protein
MVKRGQAKELFTASEVARFCQVDLKTIHNWADRGEIRHFRTPGRHLRFRRVDVLDFLRKYGYPVPEVLRQGKPRVHLVDEDGTSLEQMRDALATRFEVTAFSEPIDALIAIGSETPDAVVLDAIRRLKSVEATRHTRVIVYCRDQGARHSALEAGASAFVVRPDLPKLVETLDAMLGA